jgi:hypothetical protein
MDEKVTIYALCDESGIRYIGQTRQAPEARRKQHVSSRTSGGPLKSAWLDGLRKCGVSPSVVVLEITDETHADEAERRHIAAQRAYGAVLVNGVPGGVKRASTLCGPIVVRLTRRRFERLERLAAELELPVAVVARRLLSERLDELGDE